MSYFQWWNFSCYFTDLKHVAAVSWKCSVKVFLEISQNSQENTSAKASYLIKLQASWHRCFLVNFVKFLRTPFFTEKPSMAASEYLLKTYWLNTGNCSLNWNLLIGFALIRWLLGAIIKNYQIISQVKVI